MATDLQRQTMATPIRSGQSRTNIAAIADLLNNFDGKSGNYETWEKQIKLLKTTYELEDDAARYLLACMIKRENEWLHSKPEYIAMIFDNNILIMIFWTS